MAPCLDDAANLTTTPPGPEQPGQPSPRDPAGLLHRAGSLDHLAQRVAGLVLAVLRNGAAEDPEILDVRLRKRPAAGDPHPGAQRMLVEVRLRRNTEWSTADLAAAVRPAGDEIGAHPFTSGRMPMTRTPRNDRGK